MKIRQTADIAPAFESLNGRAQALYVVGESLTSSAFDAVDGSSTGTQVPKMWVLFEAPTIRRS